MKSKAFPFAMMCGLIWGSMAHADPLRVVADIAPVHSLVAQVMAGVAEPTLILPRGASPHGYAMRPSEARALQSADLVVWIGPELTPWLDRARENLAAEATELVLMTVPDTRLLPVRDLAVFAEEGHAGHNTHAHGGVDPHVWLDPKNAEVWVGVIAAQLSVQDPENAAVYSANAKAAQAALATLQTDLERKFAAINDAPYLVYHDAYQYLEVSFDLNAVGAVSASDASRPSAARISELQSALAANKISCIFSEPQFSPSLVSSLQNGSDVKGAFLDPMGTALEPGPAFYGALLNDMSDQIVACLN